MARQQPWYKLRHLEQYWIYSEHHSKNWPQENGINAIAHNSLYLCGRQNNRSLFWPHVWAGNWNCQPEMLQTHVDIFHFKNRHPMSAGESCRRQNFAHDAVEMEWCPRVGICKQLFAGKEGFFVLFCFVLFFCRKELSAGGPFWLVTLAKPYCN